jgi:hypothetical protein
MAEIDLGLLTGNGEVRNLTGHENGVAARESFNLRTLDHAAEPVRVIVPEPVLTIAPSFFQGMFTESVRELGDNFLEHYRFHASAIVMRQVERGIALARMRRGNVLAVA